MCREIGGSAERQTVGWREVYHELKRLEFRGEVLRGYFVLVTLGGRIILSSEGRGSRVRVREGVSSDEVAEAARVLGERLVSVHPETGL